MRQHHRRVVEELAQQFSTDPRFPAAILAGSVVKGLARDDSDVDIVLVAAEEEWASRLASKDYFYYDRETSDYPGGYVDGKVVDFGFLVDAADHGSEPTRFAFQDSVIIYSRIPELASLLQRIPVFPERQRDEKMAAFYSQVALYAEFFVPEAEKRNDSYLLARAVSDLALFGGRLFLALNRVLFPSHKWLLKALGEVIQKPPRFMGLMHELLRTPCSATAGDFYKCIRDYRDWGLTFEQAVSRYIEYSEWGWRRGTPALQDW